MRNMEKTERICVSLPKQVLDAVKKKAEQEGRSYSNMIALILRKEIQKDKAAYSR